MVYNFSEGITRLINLVCDNAMLKAKQAGIKKISINELTNLVNEGLISAIDPQKEVVEEKRNIKPLSSRIPKNVIKFRHNDNNGNGKRTRIFDVGDEYAGLDMGMLAIA